MLIVRTIFLAAFFTAFISFGLPGVWAKTTVAADERPLNVFSDIRSDNELKKASLLNAFGQDAFTGCFDCAGREANPFAMAACLREAEACLRGDEIAPRACPADRVFSAGDCISLTDGCRERYGEHSYHTGERTANNLAVCACAPGYAWDSGRTACVETACAEGYVYYSPYRAADGEFLNGRCETPEAACRTDYGENAVFARREAGKVYCACRAGWDWGADGTCGREIEVRGIENIPGGEVEIEKNDALTGRLAGRVVLQVEDNGEAWYVNPLDMARYYLGRPADAFSLMRRLGLGVSNRDFSIFGDRAPARLAGRILLKVENKGEAYYVNPLDLKMHYLGRPADAYGLMRELGLGIKTSDLAEIEAAPESPAVTPEYVPRLLGYVSDEILPAGSLATVKKIGRQGEYYKVTLELTDGDELVFYLTEGAGGFAPAKALNAAELADKLKTGPQSVRLELFVMSHCPYGVQMEKAVIPVVKALGGRVDFSLKFLDYAMHGLEELEEELRQHCIGKNEPEKLLDYLECFTETGAAESCLELAAIDRIGLGECVSATDGEYRVTESYDDPATWFAGRYPQFQVNGADVDKYNIAGSPALVIDGKVVSPRRDPASILAAVCASFSARPEACANALANVIPSPGFGSGQGSSSGSCTR